MKYSTRTRYGLRFLVYLAAHSGERYVQLSEIEKQEKISLRYLEQIIRLLKPSGVLLSLRGKYGGYKLSRPAEDIILSDLVEHLEGDLAPIACLGPDKSCERFVDCPTLPMWKELQSLIVSFLQEKTLKDLLNQQKQKVSG